jgi:hypothetical protein
MAGGGHDNPAERLAVVAVVGGVTRAEAEALDVLVQDHNRSAPARPARASMRARRVARDPAGALTRSPQLVVSRAVPTESHACHRDMDLRADSRPLRLVVASTGVVSGDCMP